MAEQTVTMSHDFFAQQNCLSWENCSRRSPFRENEFKYDYLANFEIGKILLTLTQYDQIAILFIQYLTIYNKDNLSNSQIIAKAG